jgi:aminoglycoside phosphotransferase (APT) family kinase protein
MSEKVWISCRTGVIKATVLARLGDYAITREYAGAKPVATHLPTGLTTPHPLESTRIAYLTALLNELQSVPAFDLQGFEAHRPALRAAFERTKGGDK